MGVMGNHSLLLISAAVNNSNNDAVWSMDPTPSVLVSPGGLAMSRPAYVVDARGRPFKCSLPMCPTESSHIENIALGSMPSLFKTLTTWWNLHPTWGTRLRAKNMSFAMCGTAAEVLQKKHAHGEFLQ